ncbi:uncharacterized protein [Lolium perenne]|nr:uncharacterized protein LOC127333345 isoform X2 [Lolium perenne]
MIGALIRQYWPGFYTPVLGGERKLAETWADYEAAPCPGFGTAADAVYTKFWTHYKVPDDMVERGKAVLTRASQRLTRQQWYNQKHTCIGHFKAEQGIRVKKADNIRDDPQLTKEDYLRVMPLWCENKEDAFEALVARWVGEDADFNAKSVRNKANRGTGGTHSAGSRSTERYRKHKEAELGEPLTEVGGWQKMKLKQPDLSQPQPSLPEYFGYAEEELDKYCSAFKGLHPEVDDPIEQETDLTAIMVAGRGSEHGRTKLLSGVIKPQRTLTQIRSTLTAGDPPVAPPRHRRTDANFEAAYAATYEKYLTVVAEWDLKRAAWEEYQEATSRALRTFFQTGERIALPEEEPPRPGPTLVCPSREAFAATYYARTPGTGSSRNRPSPDSSREGTPDAPRPPFSRCFRVFTCWRWFRPWFYLGPPRQRPDA